MTQAQRLYQLQTIELQLEADRQRVPQIEDELGESQALLQARRDLEIAQVEHQRWAIRTRDLELELGGVNSEITTTEQRLYGGRVTNPKELRDLQQKAAALKRHRQALEDQLLEAMVNEEEAQEQVEQRQTSLSQVERDWQASQAALRQELADLTTRIEENVKQCQVMRQSIPASDVAVYDQVRMLKGSVAVAELKDGVCGFCAVSPSSQHLKHLQAGRSLMYCANCGRILFIP